MPEHLPDLAALRRMEPSRLPEVCRALRTQITSGNSGKTAHIESSLGVAELTVALHYVLNTPEDVLIWDVGHQAYGHKILTDRAKRFSENRTLGGISGFPSREESPFDSFGTGHSSTSISAILGMALENHRRGKSVSHVAVIGDGALTGGMSFEALNHLGSTDLNVLIVLNDNRKAIDPNTGALYSRDSYRQYFEALGIEWLDTVNGADVEALESGLRKAKQHRGPGVLHVRTQITQLPAKPSSSGSELYFHSVFGEAVTELAELIPNMTVITPAMISGAGLNDFAERFPDKLIDVGIAEQHAVTLAAGIAAAGGRPLVHLYSTFAQRAYDQIIHDVALQNLPVVFCLDRAGVVGEDGATHHGAFDLAFLRNIPNLVVAAPRNGIELRDLLFTGLQHSGPFVLRYPRDTDARFNKPGSFNLRNIGRAEWLKKGETICLMATGTMSRRALEVAEQLESEGFSVGVLHHLYVKPLDTSALTEAGSYPLWIGLEDGVRGGLSSALAEYISAEGRQKLEVRCLPDLFMPHGTVDELHKMAGLDRDSIANRCRELLS